MAHPKKISRSVPLYPHKLQLFLGRHLSEVRSSEIMSAVDDEVMNPMGNAVKTSTQEDGKDNKIVADAAEEENFGKPALATRTNLIVFGFLTFFWSLLAAAYSVGTLVFVTHYGMSVQWIANVNIITTVEGSVLTFVVSYYGDMLQSRFGRRKPFVIAGKRLLRGLEG